MHKKSPKKYFIVTNLPSTSCASKNIDAKRWRIAFRAAGIDQKTAVSTMCLRAKESACAQFSLIVSRNIFIAFRQLLVEYQITLRFELILQAAP
jgi:hypothetical protein